MNVKLTVFQSLRFSDKAFLDMSHSEVYFSWAPLGGYPDLELLMVLYIGIFNKLFISKFSLLMFGTKNNKISDIH